MLDNIDGCDDLKATEIGRRFFESAAVRFHAERLGLFHGSSCYIQANRYDAELARSRIDKLARVTTDIEHAFATQGW